MKRWIQALFLPLLPPTNYCVAERNFETEYESMKKQYLKKQERTSSGKSICEAKLNMPLAWTLR
jgi:hypothetical protein